MATAVPGYPAPSRLREQAVQDAKLEQAPPAEEAQPTVLKPQAQRKAKPDSSPPPPAALFRLAPLPLLPSIPLL
jgi:hypothetical protein